MKKKIAERRATCRANVGAPRDQHAAVHGRHGRLLRHVGAKGHGLEDDGLRVTPGVLVFSSLRGACGASRRARGGGRSRRGSSSGR